MGVVPWVDAAVYPTQSEYVGRPARVCFNYDTANTFPAVVLRDDTGKPWLTVLRLDDGRCVLGSECQWTPQIGDARAK